MIASDHPERPGSIHDSGGAQTLLRGLAVLEAVASGHATLAAIGEAIGCPRSTTQRLASSLARAGYLRPAPGQTYALGMKLIQLGYQAREHLTLPALARPHLEVLAAATRDTVHLGIQDGDAVLYLDKLPGQRGLEMRSRIGHHMPLAFAGIGRALMLDMDEAQWRSLYDAGIRAGVHRPTPWKDYAATLRGYAHAGVSMDFEDNEPGICCVAAPVRDVRNAIVAAISVASAVTFMPRERMQTLMPEVLQAAAAISRELGWQSGQAVCPASQGRGS